MKKIPIIRLIALLIATTIVVQGEGVGSIDTQCRANGFDYGIIRYEWNKDISKYEAEDPPPKSPYSITVSGDATSASWTADPAVDGVLHKESLNTYLHAGGTIGTVNMVSNEISHITFCGKETTVPEFTSLAVALVILLTTPAFAYLIIKKKH